MTGQTRYGCAMRRFLPILLVLWVLPAGPGPFAAARLPHALQASLEEPLKARVAALLAEKNQQGASFKRGSYSRNFLKVDDATYQVSFHQDTAKKDRLLTERNLLTLVPNPEKSGWSVQSAELKDSYEGLFRLVPGDEKFFSFSGFHFSREGLTVQATHGELVQDYRRGQTELMLVAAEDLAFAYQPPGKLDQSLYTVFTEEHPGDLIFDPEYLFIACAPATCQEILTTSFDGMAPISSDEADPRIRKPYDEFINDQRESRKTDGFSGFERPYEEGRRILTMVIKKNGVDQRVFFRYDSVAPREVSFGATGLGRLFAYYSQATREGNQTPYQLERRDDLDARDNELDTLTGEVELALVDSEAMAGDLHFGLTLKRDLREIPFHIAQLSRGSSSGKDAKHPRMIINSIRDGDDHELTWVKTGPVSGLVVLPALARAGTKLSLHVQFENKACIYKLTPSYSYLDRGGWLPFVRPDDMIDALDLTVKVPATYKTLGIGQEVENEKEGKVSITRWVADAPVSFPTVIYGDYVEATPDFDATKSTGEKIPVTMHVDRVSVNNSIRPKQLKPLVNDAANALNLYREIFGVDYPYGKLDLVNDPGFGGLLYGQSPSSIVYIGNLAFRGEGALADFGAGSGITKFVKSLVSHEVGHQWWGSRITNANSRNYWFVESLAEYASALFLETSRGPRAYQKHVKGWRDEVLAGDLHVSVQDATTLYGLRNHQTAVYAKGPYVFHIMRSTFGDKKFFAFLKMLAQDLKGREIVTRDIQKEAEKAFGVNMEGFFDQWIRGVGIPEFTLKYKSSRQKDGNYLVEGTIRQRVLVGKEKHEIPDRYYLALVRLMVGGKKNTIYPKNLVVNGPETSFRAKVPEAPRSVVINKDGEVLAYDVIVQGAS
ncbi:MAG: M1 family metallopeptidase [Acidobacteriota bacterium]